LPTLTRFLFKKGNDFNAERVKAQAFFNFKDPRISVFDTTDVDSLEVWQWGEEHVVPKRQQPVLARADFPQEALAEPGLHLELDEPPPRHHNICKFPAERHAMMAAAQHLADAATLLLKPSADHGRAE
jgi:hypothetical protein